MIRKIAYLTGEYPRATDTFIQREVAGLRAAGREVLTCSVRTTGADHLVGPEQREEARRTFYILKAAKNPARLLATHTKALTASPRRYFGALKLALSTRAPGFKSLMYQLFYFAEAGILAQHMTENKVEHLHNHIATAASTVAMLAARLSGIPFSFTLHGPDIFFEPHRWRLDAKIAEASFVACISHFCRSQAMVFSEASQWSKLSIVHCGVDPARYDGQSARGKTDPPHLIFVGRLAGVKGVPLLLSVLPDLQADCPDLKVTLIGDGPDRAALEAQAEPFGEMVRFTGYQSQDEVAQALGTADIFVLPSFAEGVPVVLMEAMAAGLPVVTTRIAGVPELVEDGTSGLLVPPGDADALRDALFQLLQSPDRRRRMGQAGRAAVIEGFDAASEARWLATLIDGHRAGDPMPLRPEGRV